MSTIKTLINEEVQKQMQTFYKLADFVNRYWYVLVTFVLSLLIVLSFSLNEDTNVIAYSSTDVLNVKSLAQSYIWYKNPKDFNKRIKWLQAQYILSSTTIKKDKIYLGQGLFRDNYGFYYPNGVVLLPNYLFKETLGLRKKMIAYFLLLQKMPTFSYKVVKVLRRVWLSVPKMKTKYNLYCIDSFLNNSVFCNTNKVLLLKKIEIGKEELSAKAYNYLFNNLFLPSQEKCNILKKIYSKMYNYPNIKFVAEKYCSEDELYKFKSSFEVVKMGKDIFSSNIPSTYDAQMDKLADQWYYLLSSKKIPNENIISHVEFVRKLLARWILTYKEAFLELNVINTTKKKIKSNVSSNNVIQQLNLLINGDTLAWFKWLKSLVGKVKLINLSNSEIIYKNISVHSVRERFLSLIKNYSNIFILSRKIQFNSKSNVAILQWYLTLLIPTWQNSYKKKKVLISFTVPLNSIVGSKFKITNFQILDKKISQYLKSQGLSYPTSRSLTMIYEKLNSILANYILNKKNTSLSFCDVAKIKLKDASCSGYTIKIRDNKIVGLTIEYVFDKFQVIRKVNLPSQVKVEIKKGWSSIPSYLSIKLNKFSTKLNNLVSKKSYWLKDVYLIATIIQKYISKYKKAYEIKQIWLKPDQLLNLENLLHKYLGAKLVYVKHLQWKLYDVYFTLNEYKFESVYDLSKNKFSKLVLVLPKQSKQFDFSVDLSLSDLDLEKLNDLRENTLDFLSKIDSQKVEEYRKVLEKVSR